MGLDYIIGMENGYKKGKTYARNMMNKNEFPTRNQQFSFGSLHNVVRICADFLLDPGLLYVDIVLSSILRAMKRAKDLHRFERKRSCCSHGKQISVCDLRVNLAILFGIVEDVFPARLRHHLLQIFVSLLQTLIYNVPLLLVVIGSFKSCFPR